MGVAVTLPELSEWTLTTGDLDGTVSSWGKGVRLEPRGAL